MTAAYEIPTRSASPERFDISLSGTDYRLTIKWNQFLTCWVLDIDTPRGFPVVHGLPVVTGTDLLKQSKHLGIPGELRASTDGDVDTPPTFENLGQSGHLYYVLND